MTCLQSLLYEEAMFDWGWRIPLLLSAPLGLAALYLRLNMEESSAYRQADDRVEDSDESAAALLRRTTVRQWRPLVLCVALVLTYNMTDYLLTGYLPTYLQTNGHVPHTAGLLMIVLTLLVLMATVVLVARLSDRIGTKPLLGLGCVMLLSLSVPAFELIHTAGSYPMAFAGVLLIGVMLLCFDATLSAMLPALFPTPVRYGALALVFAPEVAGRRLPGAGPAVESEEQARELAGD